ncbi:serine/threonine-protein kinase SIK2-like [Panonychus citri]|uniref:serine/threonine-protein kinase SIK2-like n=1 Tax=Panonychus citri TaxID=50023 RepID=UPI00230804CB|nr:serine/threonine-protein kinase SIK2-like [Panonychus citri]
MAAGLYDITNETLGKGHFAIVKLARHCLTGELVAVKIIDKMKLKKEGLRQLGLEIKLLSRLSEKEHPNIVKLYQVIDTKTKLYLVMEYPGKDVCDLYDYIDRKSSKGLKETEARHIFRQICSAIHYCHSLRIVHRDLKPENILIVNQPTDCNITIDGHLYPLVKLIDFGFSNQWDEGEKLRTSCGSLAYSAPEILLGDHYDGDKVDIWGLGCILYILLYGYNPFMQINDSETLIKILDCSFTTPRRPSICDSSIHLIKSLLQRDPNSRLTIKGVLDHCWLKASHEDDENESEDGGNCSDNFTQETISISSRNESSDLNKLSPVKLPKTESNIHEKVIDHMLSQGMCSSKDHVESALKKTRDRVNRTKSSELITSPVEISVQVPLPINGEKLNENKSSQDNYVTATYHLLKDKLVRELHHNNTNSTASSESQQSKEKHHLKTRRGPRKPIVQQAPRLRPNFGSPLRDSSNDKSNKVNQLEVSSSEDDQSFILPLARKCSIVSEEGSCAGTDISGNDGPNEPLLEIEPTLYESSRPSVDIIVTDFSENDHKSVDECIEEADELDSCERELPIDFSHDNKIDLQESQVKVDKINHDIGGDTTYENNKVTCDETTDRIEEESSPRLLKTSSNEFIANQLHLVSSSPELLREDDFNCELRSDDEHNLSSVDCDPSNIGYPTSHRTKPSLALTSSVTASPTMILADGQGDSKNDIGDHVINHLTHNSNSKSTTNGGSTTTSLRIIVQSKSCNNILFGDEDRSCLPCNTSSSSAVSKSRKGLSSNYRVSSLLKRNKDEKADCCSIC